MKRSRTTIIGIACGLACAACVFAYAQGVRGEADAARAEALARYGGEQLEVCVAKRDIAAGESVDASAVETRLWVADLLPAEAFRSSDDVVGKKRRRRSLRARCCRSAASAMRAAAWTCPRA